MTYTIEKVWVTTAGLRAVVMRHVPTFEGSPLNFRCGYVEVPNTNMYYGMHCRELDVDVHWGLTFSSSVGDSSYPINFNYEKSWWLGYDCGHLGDDPETQDLNYCIAQCESLAAQLIIECEE